MALTSLKHWVAVEWEVVDERVVESYAHTTSGCRDRTCSPLGVDKRLLVVDLGRPTRRVQLFESTAGRSTGIMRSTGPDGAVGSTYGERYSEFNEWTRSSVSGAYRTTTTSRCCYWFASGSESLFLSKKRNRYTDTEQLDFNCYTKWGKHKSKRGLLSWALEQDCRLLHSTADSYTEYVSHVKNRWTSWVGTEW